jgi:hypothetical protein
MIFERRVLLSINKNAVRRRKHPARNDRYGFPIPSAHAALAAIRTPLESRPSIWSRTVLDENRGFFPPRRNVAATRARIIQVAGSTFEHSRPSQSIKDLQLAEGFSVTDGWAAIQQG